jgi:Icc protein
MAVSFVQLTDTHLVGDPQGSMRGVVTRDALRRVLAKAAPTIATAEAILLTGDVVHDDADGYAAITELLSPFAKPVLVLPGNHDDPQYMRAALAASPFDYCPSRLFGRWQVILLDSVIPGEAGGELAASELDRLDSALAAHPDHHALIALHHHPINTGSHWLEPIGVRNAAEFFAVIDRHPQVRVVIWGHVHQAQQATRGVVQLLGTPSTCVQFRAHSDDFALDNLPPAWRELRLHDNGQVETILHHA